MFSQQRFTVRRDLVTRPVRLGNRLSWVIKDPVARKYFHFNEQEYAIFSWLDGSASVQTILDRFCRRFTPAHLTATQLSGFLSELARANLLKGQTRLSFSSSEPPVPRATVRKLQEIARNPLAIRLPGINPARFLDALQPWCRWMFSTPALLLGLLLILIALTCATIRFDEIAAAVPELRLSGASRLLLTTAVVLIGTKIIHELAHALTARHFQVRCESMGILLLLLTPCLYCDVSDAWLLASRRARIAISAAGILAELVLASLATLLWMITQDEPTRFVLLTVMLVCSVNTLLFNGNPLMRYDGYFILSDLLGIPNLAAEANSRIIGTLRAWIWGEPPAWQHPRDTGQLAVLWVYGLLSAAYRVVLLIIILAGLYRTLSPTGLGILGAGVAVWVCFGFVGSLARSLFRPPVGTLLNEPSHLKRPLLAGHGVLVVLLCLLLIPFPYRIDAPFRIESSSARDLFTPVAGELIWAVAPGTHVQAGDRIAELRNPGLELELQKVGLQLVSERSRLKSLEARRGLLEDSDERPALMQSIASLEKRLAVLVREQKELIILAPLSGWVHEPPNVTQPRLESTSVSYWSGTPLDPANRNCHLPQGTHLCTILEESQKEAVLYVGQKQIREVHPGEPVRLWFPGLPSRQLMAHVNRMTPAPIDDIPRELLARNAILLNPDAPAGAPQPQEPVYRVTARLTDPNAPLPLRATGQASVRGPFTCLWKRLGTLLSDSFSGEAP